MLLKELLLEMEDEVRSFPFPRVSRNLGADFSRLQLHGAISTEFYDPVFCPEDKAYLTSQGHSVLSGDVSRASAGA